MKRFYLVLVVFSISVTICHADPMEQSLAVAKIDYHELEPLLLEVAFERPENAEILERYQENQTLEQRMMTGDLDPTEMAQGAFVSGMALRSEVEALAKGELILLINEVFGDRYQLVIDDSYGDGLVYTQVVIPDITPNIQQHLLTRRISMNETSDQTIQPSPAPGTDQE